MSAYSWDHTTETHYAGLLPRKKKHFNCPDKASDHLRTMMKLSKQVHVIRPANTSFFNVAKQEKYNQR